MPGTTAAALLRRRLPRALALAAIAFAVPSSCTLSNEEDEPGDGTQIVQGLSCGTERWSVKTGTDAAAASVNLTPQDTTIAALGGLSVPSGLGSSAPRLTPYEFNTYRLTNVTFTQYKLESDSDYHLVLSDGTHTMIAEIPAPGCVGAGSPFLSNIQAARSTFDASFTASGSFKTANVPATLTGVAFFDLQHGQTGVAPNAIELHTVLSICFGTDCAGAQADFSLAANPTAVSVTQGGAATASISATTSSGFAGSIALSASGVPAGATASFSPASITPGTPSTLTLDSGNAAAGSYPITVTGTSGALTHSATVTFTINPPGGGLTNGGFEDGTLSGWAAAGSASAVSGGHGGTYAARVGSTTPTNGDSSISQTFVAPAGSATLSFFYKVVCPDSITYDWATATLTDNTTASTATVLTKTCTNGGAWVQASAALVAGHSYTLKLISHDDNYATDPTYTLFDDVVLNSAPPPPSGILNGNFEAGSLSSWTKAGTASMTTTSHAGSWAALVGSTVATNGDSSLSQTFDVPSGASQLSLWYANRCPDTVTYDWATVTLKDNTAGTTATLLPKTCASSYVWTNLTAPVVAGHNYTLTLTSHDDNYASDPTYTVFDDVTLN
jgi:hypothetical protein